MLRAAPRIAIQAILETAGINHQNLSEEHISFNIAPRMNALGRLSDANPMVDFLLTESTEEAQVWASRLDGLNNERKEKSDQVFSAAMSQIDRDSSLKDGSALVISHPSWPGGIVGIVASRLVERYRRPVVLLTAPEGENARGSARSIEGINITAAISENSNLLHGFGGHPMAAGLSLPAENIPLFRKALCRTIDKMMAENPPQIELDINADVVLDDITLDLVKDLERLAPFGPGNPALVFASWNLELVSTSKIGKHDEHLKLIVRDPSDVEKTVLWWGGVQQDVPKSRFDLAYKLRASNFQGKEEVAIEWIDAREIEIPAEQKPVSNSSLVLHDFRNVSNPMAELENILQRDQPLIWAEGQHGLKMDTANRQQLSPAPALVLWNMPPYPNELQEILKIVSPRQIYIFSVPTVPSDTTSFTRIISGLLTDAIDHHKGLINLKELAAATGQREQTVQEAVKLFAAMGKITIHPIDVDVSHTGTSLKIERKKHAPDLMRQHTAQTALKNLFRETHEFQDLFKRRKLDTLFNPGKRE